MRKLRTLNESAFTMNVQMDINSEKRGKVRAGQFWL